MTKLPRCPKCGRVFSWRYYYIHVKKCKGKKKIKEKQKKLNGFLSEDSIRDSKKFKRKDKKRRKRKKRR